MEKDQAIKRIAEAAVACERAYGFPAEVLFAQCALESGYLKHAPGNNPFGIKYVPGRHQDKQLLRTREWFSESEAKRWASSMDGRDIVATESGPDARGKMLFVVRDWFARYATLTDACADYVRLLTRGRYKAAWDKFQQDRDVEGFLRGIAAAGYSTESPEKYVASARRTLTPDVMQVIGEARSS